MYGLFLRPKCKIYYKSIKKMMKAPFPVFFFLALFLFNIPHVISQKATVTGYLQPQWQLGDEAASLQVGTSKEPGEDGMYNRVGIRRGRIKFFYDNGTLGSGGFQFNVIDKPGLEGAQVQIKELYMNLKAPWNKASSFQAGIFNRPFSFEINYSTSALESPERSRIITTLLPDECDLGGMLILTPPKDSPLNFLTLQGGLFAGNGINPETDSRKDFIGQLTANKQISKNASWGLGVSYYHGGVYQTNDSVYSMNGNMFLLDADPNNKGGYAKRQYLGFDAQFNFKSDLGCTQLRGEYIVGTQPGTSKSSSSPSRAALPVHEDTYIRPFQGGYVVLVHDIGKSPFSGVLKYEVYDPNVNVQGDEIGVAGSFTGKADIMYATWGAGMFWSITPDIRATLYYEMNSNEISTSLAHADYRKDFSKNRKDNVLTFRIQYRF